MRLAMTLTALILVVEVVGGIASNSLALLSDAGHVLTDLLALGLTWFGLAQERRDPTPRMTYGYHRVGLLIAVVNALLLSGVSVYIFYHAYLRLQAPPQVQGPIMLAVALVGLAANVGVMLLLQPYQGRNLNIRSAFLNVAGDALASVAVVVGGVIISMSGFYVIDPLLSILVGVLIIIGAWSILRESLPVFLEAAPAHLDTQEIHAAIRSVAEVRDVHDLHVWSIAPGMNALSVHVLVDDCPISHVVRVRTDILELLRRRFRIEHATIQFECAGCGPDVLVCVVPREGGTANAQGRDEGGPRG
ncbi:MAG: cation diffusion facilitator family transporter [Chloroflexota bacterium]